MANRSKIDNTSSTRWLLITITVLVGAAVFINTFQIHQLQATLEDISSKQDQQLSKRDVEDVVNESLDSERRLSGGTLDTLQDVRMMVKDLYLR